jgi:hypothetical protein
VCVFGVFGVFGVFVLHGAAARALQSSTIYHAERAASWLVTLGCPLEALMVGAARHVFPFAVTAILQQIGPDCLDSVAVEFITSRYAVLCGTFSALRCCDLRSIILLLLLLLLLLPLLLLLLLLW